MSSARALLLALALESSNGESPPRTTFRKQKTAFFATLVLRPEEFAMFGLVEEPGGIDVLWRYEGRPRLGLEG